MIADMDQKNIKRLDKMERRFTGFFIPAHIIENQALNWTDRIILAEIDALNINNEGCFAYNRHFVELLNIDDRTVSRSINKLVSQNLLKIENPTSKNRKMFAVMGADQPRQKRRGNPDKNIGVTPTPLSGSRNIYNEITNETLPPTPQGEKERAFSKVDFTNPAIECNLQKHLISVEQKKQRLNNIVKAFTKESDFIETGCRRFSIVESELLKSLKKFLDTISYEDSCYDNFSQLRRRAVAYIIKMREKVA